VTPKIVRAEAGQAELVAGIVAESFTDIEPAKWLVPDDAAERTRVLKADFLIMVEHALVHGHVDLLSDFSAAAVWFPHAAVDEMPPPSDYDARLAAACGPHSDRFRKLDELFDASHPHGVEHQHLAFLAVLPAVQGQGLGTVLMNENHRLLDAAGVAGYLEASGPRSRELYLRNGYRDREGAPFHLPDGPPMWPMWREPLV
jgi:GNAT superfamily N-acetyltransferase